MLFPIGDDNRDRTLTPGVNYIFIALNILVFIYFQGMGSDVKFTYAYSTVPEEILTGQDIVTDDKIYTDPVLGEEYAVPGLQETPVSVYITLITSMFMHGGFAHLFGNMIFLWVFGDNIENRLGHLRYLLFYLCCGVLASLAQVFTMAAVGGNTLIPSLGASGAISAILGGYILLYPRRRVRALIGYFITDVPAIVALGLWFVFQLISGLGVLGSGSQTGGVAYAAHIGGFIAGLLLIKFFEIGRNKKSAFN